MTQGWLYTGFVVDGHICRKTAYNHVLSFSPQVNGKPESSTTPLSTFSSLTASPTPSFKSNATDSPIIARFRGFDSDADSSKASEKVGMSEDEDDSEDSDNDDSPDGKK